MVIDPLYLFVFIGLFAPGPNVILLSTSGARFGARATWPHIAGVVLGVGVIGGVVGFGIGAVLDARPALVLALRVISFLWILALAWRLATGGGTGSGGRQRPFTIVEAVLFQWVNPKIWAIGLATSAGFLLGLPPPEQAARLAVALAGVNFFVCVFWVYFGHMLARLLTSDGAWQNFRWVMASLLALSSIAVLR